jgi:hypothetical protein
MMTGMVSCMKDVPDMHTYIGFVKLPVSRESIMACQFVVYNVLLGHMFVYYTHTYDHLFVRGQAPTVFSRRMWPLAEILDKPPSQGAII